MKDRIRESLFSRLGGLFDSGLALDLFAGTGILGIESVSRGANSAVLVERSKPALADIRRAVERLELKPVVTVHDGDAFAFVNRIDSHPSCQGVEPWLVFICPPYEMWQQNEDDLLAMLNRLIKLAPLASMFCVETPEDYDPSRLPSSLPWGARIYRPALVAIAEKTAAVEPESDTSQDVPRTES